jgi:hypothetical protein
LASGWGGVSLSRFWLGGYERPLKPLLLVKTVNHSQLDPDLPSV